jgi:hypothetical protein
VSNITPLDMKAQPGNILARIDFLEGKIVELQNKMLTARALSDISTEFCGTFNVAGSVESMWTSPSAPENILQDDTAGGSFTVSTNDGDMLAKDDRIGMFAAAGYLDNVKRYCGEIAWFAEDNWVYDSGGGGGKFPALWSGGVTRTPTYCKISAIPNGGYLPYSVQVLWGNGNILFGVGTIVKKDHDARIEVANTTQAAISSVFTGASSNTGTSGGMFRAGVNDGGVMASGDFLGSYGFAGYKGTTGYISTGALISGWAADTWSGTSIPTDMHFKVAPTGSIVPVDAMIVRSTGNVELINNYIKLGTHAFVLPAASAGYLKNDGADNFSYDTPSGMATGLHITTDGSYTAAYQIQFLNSVGGAVLSDYGTYFDASISTVEVQKYAHAGHDNLISLISNITEDAHYSQIQLIAREAHTSTENKMGVRRKVVGAGIESCAFITRAGLFMSTVSVGSITLPNIAAGVHLFEGIAGNGNTLFRRADGSYAGLSAVQNAEVIGRISSQGYGATGWGTTDAARIDFTAGENWTDANQAGEIKFYTRPTASVAAPALCLTLDKNGKPVFVSSTLNIGTYDIAFPATGTVALLGMANVFTTQQMVDGTSDQIQLRVQGHSTQTANLQTWEDSAGVVSANITGAGTFQNIVLWTDPGAAKNALRPRLSLTATAADDTYAHIACDFSLFTYGDKNFTTANGLKGVNGTVYNYGSGTIALAQGLVFAGGCMSTGNITTLNALAVQLYGTGAGNVVTYRAINIADLGQYNSPTTMTGLNIATSTGAVGTNKYGIRIGDISGATNNYAIYTGLGLNRFGDQISIAGNADRQQFIVTGFTTQDVATSIAQFTRNDTVAGISAMATFTVKGSGAAGDGGLINLRGKSSSTAATLMGTMDWQWVSATHASRKSRVTISAYDTAVRECIRLEASGAAPMVGFYGGTAVIRGTALTAADASAVNSGDATTDAVINNMRTRINEIDARLGSATGVNLFA